jgi:hypothetical protein
MTSEALEYYIHDGPDAFRLKLSGSLVRPQIAGDSTSACRRNFGIFGGNSNI